MGRLWRRGRPASKRARARARLAWHRLGFSPSQHDSGRLGRWPCDLSVLITANEPLWAACCSSLGWSDRAWSV